MKSIAETSRHIEDEKKAIRPRGRKTGIDEGIEREINRFFRSRGRRPRIMLGRSRQNGQRRRVNEVATQFARYGFDVDISPAHAAPQQLARMAMENDVHLVCLLFDGEAAAEFSKALNELACNGIGIVVCDGPPSDGCGHGTEMDKTAPRRIDPGAPDDVLRLLQEVMTACPGI